MRFAALRRYPNESLTLSQFKLVSKTLLNHGAGQGTGHGIVSQEAAFLRICQTVEMA